MTRELKDEEAPDPQGRAERATSRQRCLKMSPLPSQENQETHEDISRVVRCEVRIRRNGVESS